MIGLKNQAEMRHLDLVILLCLVLVNLAGLIFLYSASSSLDEAKFQAIMSKQSMLMFIGFVLIFIILLIDYQRFIDSAYFLYVINLFLLVLVFFAGSKRLGAQRWLSLFGFTFQPSEFMKITLVLMLASYFGARKEHSKSTFLMIKGILLVLPAFLLVAVQPDLGTALMLLPILLGVLFIFGTDIKALLATAFLGILSTPIFWYLLKDYQRKRLLVFLNPNLDPLGAGYTITQSKIAVGSGGLFGKGWLSGTQNQLNFLPERHTDFVFSVVGEEWGFIGISVVLLLYLIIILRGVMIISQTRDIYGKLIAAGVVCWFTFQIIINVGMTIGILPVVGLTLPFISYGGSSLLVSMIAIGLLLNVGMRRPLF